MMTRRSLYKMLKENGEVTSFGMIVWLFLIAIVFVTSLYFLHRYVDTDMLGLLFLAAIPTSFAAVGLAFPLGIDSDEPEYPNGTIWDEDHRFM